MNNINTKEYWDKRWLESPMISRQLEKVICAMIEPNTYVIDLGCGAGRILQSARKDKGCIVYGFDISERAIQALARRRLTGMRVDLETYDAFPRCDIAVCSHTLEHIENDEKLVKNISTATQKFAIIAVPNDCMDDEPEHVRKYTKESLSALVLKYFKSVEDHSVGVHLILKCFV